MLRFVIEINTNGDNDIVNLNPQIGEKIRDVKGDTVVHLFCVGSTAGLTTLEYEPGLVRNDMPNVLQRLVPDDARYDHEATWNDDNGHSHIRAALIGPSLTVPVSNGKLQTGEYQQVVLIDFDTRPRRRKIIGTVVG